VGQSWHTVAQLQSQNTVPVLENVSLMRDSEVEKWMEEEGIDGNEKFFIGAALVENGDRTESGEVASLRRRRL
jgi:hypothetical protein